MKQLRTIFRPLGIRALEDNRSAGESEAETALEILRSIVGTGGSPVREARHRYREVAKRCDEPHIVPMEPIIMRHVIAPLAEAKKCYLLGMPVACIAQAGLVGEMVALWRFRMLEKGPGKVSKQKLSEVLQGEDFESLGQVDRVKALRELESMDAETVSAFGELRGIRREYMHYMVDAKKDPDRDALRAMRFATALVVKTLGLEIKHGILVFPPRVSHFIRGIVSAE